MDRPTTTRPDRSALAAGRWGRPARAYGSLRHAKVPVLLQAAPLPAEDLCTLQRWLAGTTALRPGEARHLLERALDRGQLLGEPALHCRAVKARIAVDANWAPMGFRLVLD